MELLIKNALVIDVAQRRDSISLKGGQTRNGNLSFGKNVLKKCFGAINRPCNFSG